MFALVFLDSKAEYSLTAREVARVLNDHTTFGVTTRKDDGRSIIHAGGTTPASQFVIVTPGFGWRQMLADAGGPLL